MESSNDCLWRELENSNKLVIIFPGEYDLIKL